MAINRKLISYLQHYDDKYIHMIYMIYMICMIYDICYEYKYKLININDMNYTCPIIIYKSSNF